MEQIKVILADFDEAARQMMAEELAAMEDITVAGQTGMAEEVLDLARTTEAQVLIMEMSLRGGDGLEVLERVKHELGDRIRVLICSLFADRALVNGAVQRGADYYMIKPVTITALAEHIRPLWRKRAGRKMTVSNTALPCCCAGWAASLI